MESPAPPHQRHLLPARSHREAAGRAGCGRPKQSGGIDAIARVKWVVMTRGVGWWVEGGRLLAVITAAWLIRQWRKEKEEKKMAAGAAAGRDVNELPL